MFIFVMCFLASLVFVKVWSCVADIGEHKPTAFGKHVKRDYMHGAEDHCRQRSLAC